MSSPIIPFLIKRYLRFNKRQPFISISAILAFFGICVGVMVLIVAMALMNGFDKEFERKLFVMNYPLTMFSNYLEKIDKQTLETLETDFPHLKFSPFIQTQAFSKMGQRLEGGIVFGVDFQREALINPIFAKAYQEAQTSYKQIYQAPYIPNTFDVIVGEGLKEYYGLQYQSNLLLIFTNAMPNAMSISPTIKRFNVNGFFHSGLLAYDKGYIYTTLESLSIIKNMPKDTYDGIHIYSNNPQKDILLLQERYPQTKIIGWWEQNGNFFAALALEKRALFIVLMLIILIASLNIITSLLSLIKK